MPSRYRNTLKAHAYALNSLGKALRDLAHDHRVVASAIERGQQARPTDGQLADWIATACEISAAAESLVALQVELARNYGVTWDAMAGVLGISRQAAWERFGTHARRGRTHRLSQLRQAHRAAMFRRMAAGQSQEVVATLRKMMPAERTRSSPAPRQVDGTPTQKGALS